MSMRWYYAGFEVPARRKRSMSAVGALILANAVVFILAGALSPGLQREFIMRFGLVPRDVLSGSVWQLATYMFIHGGLWHIVFNMFALWMFGREFEELWGKKRFLAYYFTCGVGSGVIATVFQPHAAFPIVGASGAVFGVLLAFGLTFPNRLVFLWFLIPVRAIYLVVMFAAVEFMLTLSGPNTGVSNISHIGGMAVGFVYLTVMRGSLGRRLSRSWRGLRDGFVRRRAAKRSRRERALLLRVDEILDKISREGLDSLTSKERQLLDEASAMLREREYDVKH